VTSLPLVFDAPKRGLPPRHLVDLSAAERRDAVVSSVRSRSAQPSSPHHYFARLTVDPAEMTDIPAGSRDAWSPP